MQFLSSSEYPRDFYYHRTSAEIYRPYLESCGPITTFDIGNPPQYAWKKRLFGNVYVSRYERTDIEPDIEKLKREGMKHGIITWIPYSRTDIPKGWRKMWLNDHFQETSVNIIDANVGKSQEQEVRGGEEFSKGVYTEVHEREDSDSNKEIRSSGDTSYRNKWNDRAKRAIKKFEKSGAEVRAVDPETFVEAFRNTRLKHWFKSDYISNYKRISRHDPSKVRQWCVYRDGKAVAGLACLDYLGDHSVHFVAFTGKVAYDIQAGTALIDTWFRESLEQGVKYITFDQLRNKGGPGDQKGYTEFKENFIEYRLSFPKAYFKVF